MRCFANNLPGDDERKHWEEAVTIGVGSKVEKVDSFSIVGAQNTTAVEVRLRVKGEAVTRSLKIAPETHGSTKEIAEKVRQLLADL